VAVIRETFETDEVLPCSWYIHPILFTLSMLLAGILH
jgi:hypothetical protein